MALVSVKNQYHGSLNHYVQYREEVTHEKVLESKSVVGPLTVLMCSPLGDGAAAALLVSEEFARNKGLKGPRVDASVLVSGRGDDRSMEPSTRRAATRAYEMAGPWPQGVGVSQDHRGIAPAGSRRYEDARVCGRGGRHRRVREPTHWVGGKI